MYVLRRSLEIGQGGEKIAKSQKRMGDSPVSVANALSSLAAGNVVHERHEATADVLQYFGENGGRRVRGGGPCGGPSGGPRPGAGAIGGHGARRRRRGAVRHPVQARDEALVHQGGVHVAMGIRVARRRDRVHRRGNGRPVLFKL